MQDLISIAAVAPSSTPQPKVPTTQPSTQKSELVLPDANFDPLYGYISRNRRDPMERTAIGLHNDRFKGLYTTETINENPIFGENLAATTQSTLDSVMNDVQVGAVNFGSMFASTFTSIYDMLAEMSLTPGNNSLTSKIAANRAEFEKDHLNFTSAEQVESPYLSMVTTTNGLGDFFKSSAYGLGAAAGIYVQAVLTGGLGTVPNLAKNARLLYQGTSALKGISNILKASSGVTAALKLGDYVNRGKNLVTSLAQHYIGAYGEAEFEADESKQAFLEKYKQNFYQENGRLPNKEDLVEAESVAQAAHDARFALNAALLTATNYAMISTITKPFRKVTSGLEKLTQSGVTPFLTKTGIGLNAVAPKFRPNFNFNHKLFLSAEKGINKVLPFLAKTEITWMEGVEETFQYLIQKSTDNYYSNYLNSNSNQNLKKYLDENISGVLGQMYKDRGSMLDTESIKAGLSGIISGTGQNVFANVVSKYRPKIDQNGRFTIENVDKINKDELEVIKKGVNNFFKEAVNTTSIRGLSAEKNVDQLAALTNINRQQNSTNSELTNEMLKSQSRFVSFYDAIKIGQHDIVSHIVKNQLADATLEEFNELLGYTGVHAKTVEEKGAIIDNVLSSIDKVKKSTELIESNFTNPYKVGTHVHGAFEKLKETLSYHQYMIGEVSDLKTSLEQNISELAKLPATQEMFNNQHDTLMLDIKNLKEELKLYALLDSNTTKLSAESQKDKKALEKQIENKEETLKLIDDDNLSLEHKLEAIAKSHSLSFGPNDIKNAYDYFRVTKAAENHVKAYNKLNKLTPLNFVDSFVEYMEEAQQHSEVLAKIENSADLSGVKDDATKEIIEQESKETKVPVAEVKKKVETKIVNTKPSDVTQKETSYTIEDIKQLKSVPINSMINYKGLVYRYLGDNKLATLKKPTYHFATIESDGSLSPSEGAKEWIDRAGLIAPVEASDGSLITTGLSVVDIALMKYNAAQRMLKTEKALVENLMTLIDVVADEKLPDLPEVTSSPNSTLETKKAEIERLEKEKQETLQPLIEEKEQIEKEIEEIEKNDDGSVKQEAETIDDFLKNNNITEQQLKDEENKLKNHLDELGLKLDTEYNFEDIINRIIKNVKGRFLKTVLKGINSLVGNKLKTKFVFSSVRHEDAAGQYFSYDDTIKIYIPNLSLRVFTLNKRGKEYQQETNIVEVFNKVFIHELIHAFTILKIRATETNAKLGLATIMNPSIEKERLNISRSDQKTVDSLNKIFDFLKDNELLKGEYGVSDVVELVTEALSNEGFAEKLKNIELPKELRYKSSNNNVFENIILYISKLVEDLLNLGSTYTDDNALESIAAIINDFGNSYSESDQQSFMKINKAEERAREYFKYGKSNQSDNLGSETTKLQQLKQKLAEVNKKIDEVTKRFDAQIAQKQSELKALEEQSISAKKANIEIGKVGNTEYEVKVDGVYYQGKKLNNPENKTHRQLIEADIERRKQEELKTLPRQDRIDKAKEELQSIIAKSGKSTALQPIQNKIDALEAMSDYQEAKDKINARYDAELKALEETSIKKSSNIDPSIESKLAWENWSLDTNDMTVSFDRTPEALEKRRLITEQFITGDITIDDLDLVEIPAASKPKEVAFNDESNKLVSNDGQRSDYYALVSKEDPSIILYSFRNPEMYTITPDVIASFTEETQKALKDYTLHSVVSAIKQKPQEIEKLRLALFPQKDSSKMSRWIDFTLSYFASYNYLKQNGFNKENIEKVFDLTWFRYIKDIDASAQKESVHNILYPVVLNNIVADGIVYFNNTWWEKVGTSFEQITDPNSLNELISIYSEDIFDKNLTQFYVTQIKDTEKSTFQATYLTNNSDNNPEVLKEIYELLTTELDANERLIKLTSQYHITNNLIKQKLKEQLVPSYNIIIDKKNSLANINIYFSTKEEKIKTPKYDIRVTIDKNGNVSAKSLKTTAESTETDIHIFKGIGTVSINDADLVGERQVFKRYSTFTKPKAFVEESPNVFAQAQIVQEDYLETPIEQEETPEFVEVTVNGQKYNLNMEKIYTQFPQFKDAKFESTKELLEELDLALEEADLNIEDFLEDAFPAQQNFVYLSENLEKEIETLMNTCKL